MFAVELMALIIGFGAMVLSSQRAVTAATELAVSVRVSPFVIGFTVLGLGTDLPEIANSIMSSLTDHGDVNVGDSVGSAATQATLVLGLLGILAGPIVLPTKNVVNVGILTVTGLAILTTLLADGFLGRVDAGIMFGVWAVGSFWVYQTADPHQLELPAVKNGRLKLMGQLAASFLGLGLAAAAALWAVVALAERFDAPEFLMGFFLAALGTSLPELVFDLTALRKGAAAMAIGDVLGSSFIDVTASVAAGPLIAPTAITADLAVRGTIISLLAVAFVTLILRGAKEHDWRTGVILLFTYGAFFALML